jgi:hypothetical protein
MEWNEIGRSEGRTSRGGVPKWKQRREMAFGYFPDWPKGGEGSIEHSAGCWSNGRAEKIINGIGTKT